MTDKNTKPTTKELSDADLDKVAGGLDIKSSAKTEKEAVKSVKKDTTTATPGQGLPIGF